MDPKSISTHPPYPDNPPSPLASRPRSLVVPRISWEPCIERFPANESSPQDGLICLSTVGVFLNCSMMTTIQVGLNLVGKNKQKIYFFSLQQFGRKISCTNIIQAMVRIGGFEEDKVLLKQFTLSNRSSRIKSVSKTIIFWHCPVHIDGHSYKR